MKRSQAALEFLITYGWAILAAMVAISALVYFGTTNPAGHLPDKCLFGNSLECTDSIIMTKNVSVQLVNGLGQTIYSPLAFLTDTGTACTISNADWSSDETREIFCNIGGTPFIQKDKARVKITLYYLKRPGGYNQTTSGEIYSTVQ
jgi:hypothetical protein